MIKKNEDGFYEIEYNGITYCKEGDDWIFHAPKITHTWVPSEPSELSKKTFVIKVGKITKKQRKLAEQQIKELMSEYPKTDWEKYQRELNTKLNNILRKEKLMEINNSIQMEQ